MIIPFTIEEFFAVFARYNAAIWPAQLLAYGLGIIAITALLANSKRSKPVILAVLAAFWLWNGIVYHGAFFAEINPAAYGFAALFVLQGLLFGIAAVTRNSLQFERSGGIRGVAAWALIFYATIIYELIGYAAGHGLMNGPLFGVAPCPTTIFTIGLLLLARGRPVVWLSLIPIAWAVTSTSAAIYLGVPEDLGLTAAMIILLGSLLVAGSRQGQGKTRSTLQS